MSGEGPGKPPRQESEQFAMFGDVDRSRGLAWWWASLRTHAREFEPGQLRFWLPSGPPGERDEDALFGTLVDSAPTRRKTGHAWWASTTVAHLGAIAAILVVPLLLPGEPPETIDYMRVLLYDPPPPPPPPPPKGSESSKERSPKPVSPDPQPTPEAVPTPTPTLIAELEVPDEIIPDPTTSDRLGVLDGHERGMEDGMLGGDPDFGVVGGVLGGVPGGVVGGTGTIPVYDYDRPPKPIKITKPRYPQEAFIKKVEGTVTLEIMIDEQGNVTPVRILESIPMLDAAAMRTVQEWQFMPAIKDGRRVATIARAPVTFTIF
jgi:protein TonB